MADRLTSHGSGAVAERRCAPVVSVIVVTYQTPPEMLQQCLQSVVESDYRPLELVIVDNSPGPLVADGVASWRSGLDPEAPPVVFLPQSRNRGYAGGTNRGISASRGELLLMLNPDAVLSHGAISLLVDAADRRGGAIGFAPKVLLTAHEWILDSVGLDLHLRGYGAQRGLGEPDIGQYDSEERVAGLCFAAALIRRSAFSPQQVGLLDEHFFMFYEDVDWSMRAVMRGEAFWTVPAAEVRHVHSASTRHMHSGFKARLIQRNLIWTAAKNLERRRVVKALLAHSARALLRGGAWRHPWAASRALMGAAGGLPWLVEARRGVQRGRSRSDEQVLSEPSQLATFDANLYRPLPSSRMLVSVLARRYVVAPDPELGRLVQRLTLAAQTSMVMNSTQLVEIVRESDIDISPALEWLLKSLEGGVPP
jgi:GT2 family glycosyltransferase